MEGRLATIRGDVAARWRRDGDALRLEVSVPVGCRADIELPRLGERSALYEGDRRLEAGHTYEGIAEVATARTGFAASVAGGQFAFEVRSPA